MMPRFQTDDRFHSCPEVSRAGTAAAGLYFRCGVYVAEHLLDGHVPSEIASQYGTPEWIRRLTDAGLWETEPGGYYMPLYFAHGNKPRDRVLKEREMAAARQENWLQSKRKPSSEKRRVSNGVRDASQDASQDGVRDAPPTHHPTGGKRAPARAHARGAGGAPSRPPPLPVEAHEYKTDRI